MSGSVLDRALAVGELAARASRTDGELRILFEGIADLRAVDQLKEWLPKVHAEALKLGVKDVSVDFRELDFMNSSCFKAFVVWLNALQQLEPDRQYRLCFLSNPDQHWQRRSLHALRCFAVDLVRIET